VEWGVPGGSIWRGIEMLTEEELASAYNQLDMLVQPEGDAALESLMAHIRELKRMFVSESLKCTALNNTLEEVYKELAEAYAELTRYQAQAFRGVAYEPTEEVNEEIRRWTGLTDE
jgi:uncharacterized coiled-coil DUF342 family protein